MAYDRFPNRLHELFVIKQSQAQFTFTFAHLAREPSA